MATRVWEHFGVLPDPRVERTRKHKLEYLLTITLWAVICGADTWTDMAAFGEVKEHGVRTFLELPFGIPSHDTFGRVPAALARAKPTASGRATRRASERSGV